MTAPIERLLKQLSAEGLRYLAVGGVAVVLHGYLRATADLDLFIDLKPANLAQAVDFFVREGYRPRAPVPLHSLADAEERRRWRDEKNMQVFSLWHPSIAGFEVDIFVDEPLPFEDAWQRRREAIIDGVPIPVVSIDDLISMKKLSARAKDAEDIAALEALKKSNE